MKTEGKWLNERVLRAVGTTVTQTKTVKGKTVKKECRVVGAMPSGSMIVNYKTGWESPGFKFYLMDVKTWKCFWSSALPIENEPENKPESTK